MLPKVISQGTSGLSLTTLDARYLKLDASNDPVTGDLTLNTALIVNESGGDNDTRMEGDTNQNLFFLDASTDRIGFGTATPNNTLHLASGGAFRFDDDVSLFFRTGTGTTQYLRYDTGEQKLWLATAADNLSLKFTYGGANGSLIIDQFGQGEAANWKNAILTQRVGMIVNENGADSDTRMEGDTVTNVFYLDASVDSLGILTSTPTSRLHVAGSFATITVAKTGTYTAALGDFTILCDATSAAFTVNLPAAVGVSGRIYVIKKTDVSVNAVTVDGNSSETIDGATTYSLALQYKYVMIQSDGTNWHVIANN